MDGHLFQQDNKKKRVEPLIKFYSIFFVKEAKYEIDSAVIRDISQQHFCSAITCEGKEMGYDGASFHRLVPLKWKNSLNSNMEWEFEGTNDYDGTPLKWSFSKSYQLLIYYRVK